MKFETALNLIKKTKEGYSKIAFDFSQNRVYIWPEFLEWKDFIKDGDNVLDFGCGNGRLIEILKDKKVNYIGVDLVPEFINIARQNYNDYKFQIINEKNFQDNKVILSFSDNYFNLIFCIAAFHHIPSQNLRKALLREFYRILKPGGFVILSVWNLKRVKFLKYIIKFSILKILNKMDLDFGDVFIPYQTTNKNVKIERYLHVFNKMGISKTAREAGFYIDKIYYSKGKRNLILILRK